MARSKSTTTAPAPEATPAAPAPTETKSDPEITVLRGRLTRDPGELRHTPNGTPVTTIRIAVNHPDESVTFHNVVCWRKTAETVCKYMRKGRLIEATGRLRSRTWTGNDGHERTEDELSAYRVQFVRMQPADDHQVAEAQLEVRRRDATYDMLSQIIDGLRAASSDLIEDRLDRMEPLLQRIYASADPHPAFRVARLVSRMKGGRGRVVPEITDPIYGASSETPETVLSSSQMNVLAVSVFLALNLGMPSLPLETLILDDPLQSLDDMNLLGLVDLLRRTRERRQVFISTHDLRLAGLLERKLRPVHDGQRTIVVELEGWNRDGPVITQRDLARDEAPVRIAA
jgi:single stranded DNA-binding protein